MPKASRRPEGLFFNRFLNGVEAVGNRLPHPVTLFAVLAALMIFISALCAKQGVSATGMLANRETNQVEEQTIYAVSLLNREGVTHILTQAVRNFTGYAPLGVVLVAMLGVGVAEGSGYIGALLKQAVRVTPKKMVTAAVVFLGVMSSLASDAGYVVLVPMGALLFAAYGRHPMAGLAAAFAGVSGGYSANLMIGSTEPMLAGIATEAAGLVDPAWVVEPTANWYFMIASTFLITLLGTLVTDKIVEPRLGKYHGDLPEFTDDSAQLTHRQRRALRCANWTFLGMLVLIAAAAFPTGSWLRNPQTGSLISGSPLMDGIIILIALFFLIPSVVYGFLSGSFHSEKDVCEELAKAMQAMGGFLVLAFVASQFLDYFNYSRLGTILAVHGAALLENTGIGGIPLMLLFILFSAFTNLFMGSASAKWTILAPVFVPMFMLLGYSPALTQMAYRIGDSCTNLITPLMSYFAMVVVFAKKYEKGSGIGTLISTMLPYSLVFLAGWSLLLIVWMLLGLPLGPGAGLYL